MKGTACVETSVAVQPRQMMGRKLENNVEAGAGTSSGTGKVICRYRQCMKNHAATIGGHANDGCGEFMSGRGEDGLNCAACGCHRNFHRQEIIEDLNLLNFPGPPLPPSTPTIPVSVPMMYRAVIPKWVDNKKMKMDGGLLPYQHMIPSLSLPPPPSLTMPIYHPGSTNKGDGKRKESEELEEVPLKKKRSRTKFTVEQKDKMVEFAERMDWKIQKHDELELNQFCLDNGLKPSVMKVWMHNNKHAMKKVQMDGGATTSSATSGSPSLVLERASSDEENN